MFCLSHTHHPFTQKVSDTSNRPNKHSRTLKTFEFDTEARKRESERDITLSHTYHQQVSRITSDTSNYLYSLSYFRPFVLGLRIKRVTIANHTHNI